MNSTILIIDDSMEVRENTAELLELAGYKTLMASDGKDGLQVASEHKPDLILCDIMMPELDGYGVLRAVENNSDLSGTPFIFFSAKSEKEDFRKGMDLGADDYLSKPFSGDDLLRIVDSRLKRATSIARKKNGFEKENGSVHQEITFPEGLIPENKIVKKFRKNDVIYMEGDSCNFLYLLNSGRVKTYKTNEYGKDYIIEIYNKEEFFGYLPLFSDGTHKETAIALENSEIVIIPKDNFIMLLNSNSSVSLELLKRISFSLTEAEERLIKLAYDSARKRVSESLLLMMNKFADGKENVFFPASRENISALAGISPESVSRNLTDFKAEGLIESDNFGNIKVINLRKLELVKN